MIQAGTITIGSGRTRSVTGRVLNDLCERRAMDDLSGRHCNRLADLEVAPIRLALGRQPRARHLRARFAAPRRRLAPPSDHVRVSTAGLVQNEVRRGHRVEDLPRRKGHRALMLFAHPADVARRRFPPAFNRQERMGIDVERKALPFDGAKAVVLRQCVQDRGHWAVRCCSSRQMRRFQPRRSSLRLRASVAYRAKPQDAQPSRKKRLQARSAQAQQSGGRCLPALLDRRPASSSRRESRGSSGAGPAPRKGPHRRD